MALLLVKRLDNNHPTKPQKAFKRGDIVGVYPNNFVFGRRESLTSWLADGNLEADFPAHFIIIKIPKTVKQIMTWISNKKVDDDWLETEQSDAAVWRVDLTGVPSTLNYYDVNTRSKWNKFKSRIKNRRDKATIIQRGA